MNDINPCSACSIRQDPDNIAECCMNTCMSLTTDVKECRRKCGKCASHLEQYEPTPFQHFAECMTSTSEKKGALKCCLSRCASDIACQERCIDAHNALIPVQENYLIAKILYSGHLFLLAILLFQCAVVYGYLPLPSEKGKRMAWIAFVYILLYILFQ